MKSIKMSDYFELKKPKYVYIQITPHKSIRNYNSSNIAKAIAHTYKSINKRVYREQNKLFFETNFKISYMVDIVQNNANFYFIVPKPFLTIIVEKIKEIWSKATITLLEEGIKPFSDKAETWELSYKKEDALSLYVDKKSNEPLNSILSVIDIMHETDRVCIIYNFISQSQVGWLETYNETMEKLRLKKPIIKEVMSFEYILKTSIGTVLSILDSVTRVLGDFIGADSEDTNVSLYASIMGILEQQGELSASTKRKKESTVLKTEIAVISESEDNTRQVNNALSVCQSFRVLDEDNELRYIKSKKNIEFEKTDFELRKSLFSTDEISNFIQIPGRMLLTTFGIKHIKVEETKVPSELQKGYLELGESKYKGTQVKAFLEDKYNVSQLPLLAIGDQGAGKSTFMANYYTFANKRKEGGVVIDFIKNCEMSEEVIKYLPKDDMVILDYSDYKNMQGFAFNEFNISEAKDTFNKLEIVNKQAQQVISFVDAINPTQPLQARMRKYLSGASNVVFATGETSLKAVVRCLEDYKYRAKFISMLTTEEKEYLEDEIRYLSELDKYSRGKGDEIPCIIGNNDDKIEGILDRISLLKEDTKLKLMFNKGAKDNIDFARLLEEGKTIVIRMRQDDFKKHAKNVIVTYLVSKIWIATEIRGRWNKQPKKSHICIDEVFQCRTAMQMIANEEMLPQTRKFGCKFIFSCQYLGQIDIIADTVIQAGASVMLLGGTSEADFNFFKSKIEGFEYEDLKEMEQYSSLNLIRYSGGYSSFITKLPKPIK